MTDYISNPLSTLNEDLNTAVQQVAEVAASLSGYVTTADFEQQMGDLSSILDSINGEVV